MIALVVTLAASHAYGMSLATIRLTPPLTGLSVPILARPVPSNSFPLLPIPSAIPVFASAGAPKIIDALPVPQPVRGLSLPPGVDLGAAAGNSAEARLADALLLLEKTPTGAALLAAARENNVQWEINADYDWMSYHGGKNTIRIGHAFVARYPPEQLAYMLAHELEHARQAAFMGGIPSYNPDEAEFGGLSAQSRVWAEMGAPTESETWRTGRAWLKDNALWLTHPEAAYYAWRLRGFASHRVSLSAVERDKNRYEGSDRVKVYWEHLAQAESSWRQNFPGLPVPSPERTLGAFRSVMDASLNNALKALGRQIAPAPGEFSDWMPDFLQTLSSLKIGEDFSLPAAPAAKDLQLLAFLEHEVAVYQLDTGDWRVRKGSEMTVPIDDLRGRLKVLIHNHPIRLRDDLVGRAPSARDFFVDEAPLMFLITLEGLTRYKMPAQVLDPRTREFFDPRILTYQAFRDRIYGEKGPPYFGDLAQECVRDPESFYRRLGMDVTAVPFSDVPQLGIFTPGR